MKHKETQQNAFVSITICTTSYAQFVPLFAARIKAVEEINRLRGKE